MTVTSSPPAPEPLTRVEGASRSIEWDEYGRAWVDDNPQELWRRHSDAVNAALLERWLPLQTRGRIIKTDLFDEAVSGGLYEVLASRGSMVVGLDVSPAVTHAATRRYNRLRVAGADVRELPFDSCSFGTVVSLSTLDHFESDADIARALSELNRILVPGGTMILTLDNQANPIVALRNALPYRITHGIGLVPYPVGKTSGPRAAERAVRRAGFDVTDSTTIMHAPRVLAIPLMNALGGGRRIAVQKRLLRMTMLFEFLQDLPTARFTGHFIAIRASKRAVNA